MIIIIFTLLAYGFGSIQSAVIISRAFSLDDPRTHGSNNPGATNVLRLGGKKAAALTLLGDLFKGFIPMLVVIMLSDAKWLYAAVGLAVFLGHLYPIFFNFRGGKGVATAAGVFFGLDLVLGSLLLAVWLLAAVVSRYSSVAALCAALMAPVLVVGFGLATPIIIMSFLITTLLIWRHRSNIKKLIKGEEDKLHIRI